jgi:hypothetical protein
LLNAAWRIKQSNQGLITTAGPHCPNRPDVGSIKETIKSNRRLIEVAIYETKPYLLKPYFSR